MPEFTKGELEVMQILWKHGEMKPAEIEEHFPWEITNSSLRSYLSILLDKGHLTRHRRGKAFFYRAKTKQASTFRQMLSELTRTCCDGSVEKLLCHLIRSEKLSEEDLLELKRIAETDNSDPDPKA
ncbi:Penicillinase repressor [Polystyrenella longa]|uniref:Penicillinase repressor n=1 Tax=Polystyrenella longa TaxID=2528007 RepID=A0A518CGH6_9PLAN|nr:BlaI/MecI/CopY family transcriptional regulator [Polystyrenella longa]QDU78329.1 Penicillinase repressor [Polystyrenella longa]